MQQPVESWKSLIWWPCPYCCCCLELEQGQDPANTPSTLLSVDNDNTEQRPPSVFPQTAVPRSFFPSLEQVNST